MFKKGIKRDGSQNIKKLKYLMTNCKNILITAVFLLLSMQSGIVQARSEIPNNLIQEKESKINEITLGASEGITLTRTYEKGSESITLNWSAVTDATKYTIHQSKNSGTETTFTVQETTVTLNKNNAGIKDEAAPTMPVVTATQNASQTGYNISVASSTDNGTTYRHIIKTTIPGANVVEYTEEFGAEGYYDGGAHWTSSGTSGTFVVPDGVTRLRVACVGGGRNR